MVRKLVLAVAAASALMSSNVVFALGMGDINLRSSLNQPLDAEIELLQIRDLSSQEILPALATPDEFGRAGIERVFFLNDLTFTPVVRSDGKSVIRVTSSRPVREPFLNFLVEVRWPSGRVLREFTLLLDPPLYEPGPVVAAAPVSQPARQQPVQSVQPTRPTQVQPARQPSAQSARRAAPADPLYQEPVAQATGTIRISQSDTLWEIALRHRPQGASVHQTMLAIQDLNPNAFIDNNINRLRAGENLTLPDASQSSARSQSDAVSQVAEQNARWQQRRQPAEPAERQLDARQRDTAAAAPQKASNDDELRLVGSGEDQVDGGADAGNRSGEGKLRDALDTTKEELDSVKREKAEAERRLTDMQSQMDTLQRLLALKDEQLAAMQQSMSDIEALPTDQLADAAVATLEQSASAADVTQDPLASTENQTELSESDPNTTLDAAQSQEIEVVADELPVVTEELAVTESEQVADESSPAVVAVEPPAAEQDTLGMLQRMMQNQSFLIAGGGVVLLLLLLLLMAVARRNARRESDMADNFIARAAESNETSTQDTDEFNVAIADHQEDRKQDLDIAQDPILEADALIAYGKLGQAAEVLSSAIDNEPERTDLRLKLMEVHGMLDDVEGYTEQEVALRSNGTVDHQIDLLNVRFPVMAAAFASAAVTADDYPELDDDFLKERRYEPAEEAGQAEKPIEEYDFSGFDVDSEPVARQEPVAEESLEDFDLDFDLDESLADSLAQSGIETAAPAAKDDDFEFDFDLEEPPAKPTVPAQPVENEFSLDEDFDLSLTGDFDSLKGDQPAPKETAETELEPIEVEQTVELSDNDLKGFEAELDAASAETEAHAEADEIEQVESEPATVQKSELDSEDDDEFDFLSGTDESATKLDLARAYIDMGDQEGARDILSEVIEEGNEQQQQEAREMMGQLD
jgi:pilus assembly protein FimV